jgi:crotonobetainyl-CoA:carnitine CoA-transferase CaiB-like acyl-CoA transferase
LEKWSKNLTRTETSNLLAKANVASGPVLTSSEVVKDPHLEERNMIVALPRTDEINEPVLIPGNPIKMSKVSEGPEVRVPWVGEHTNEVLTEELGLSQTELKDLKKAGIISP